MTTAVPLIRALIAQRERDAVWGDRAERQAHLVFDAICDAADAANVRWRFEIWSVALPWPAGVSVNHAYAPTASGGRRMAAGPAAWKDAATLIVKTSPVHQSEIDRFPRRNDRLTAYIGIVPPDARKRDVDNLLKLPLDAVCAGLGLDDRAISAIVAVRTEPVKIAPCIVVCLDRAEPGLDEVPGRPLIDVPADEDV